MVQEVIEMQIMYELVESKVSKWKHKSLILSVSFVVTDYGSAGGK